VSTNRALKAQKTNSDSTIAKNNADQFMGGFDYNIVKDATAYQAYSSISNDSVATFIANNYGYSKAITPAASQDP